jgi:septal ring factor EnvC (AmiA/AmiB activator)
MEFHIFKLLKEFEIPIATLMCCGILALFRNLKQSIATNNLELQNRLDNIDRKITSLEDMQKSQNKEISSIHAKLKNVCYKIGVSYEDI